MESTDRRALYSFLIVSSVFALTPLPLSSPLQYAKDLFIRLLEYVFEGATAIAGWFVVSTIEMMLFFPPPTEFSQLWDLYWGLTFPLFWGILTVVGAGFFLGMQLFPESDKADVDKFMKRVLIAVILLFAVGHGYGLVVEGVHAVAYHMYPEDYRIAVDFTTFEGIATASFTGFAVLIFSIIASPKIIITYGTFLMMLGMRMIIIYSTYVLFPILIAFWITDIGPLQYGKMLAGFIFKATILLLLFGILLAAILGVGGAIAGEPPEAADLGGEREDMVMNSDVEHDRLEGGVLKDSDPPQFSGEGQTAVTSAWVSVYTYFASIWLCITLTSMILGMSISTGLTKKMATAGKLKGGMKRMKSRMNSGGSGGNSNGGAAAGGAAGGAAGAGKAETPGGGSDSSETIDSDGAPDPEKPDMDQDSTGVDADDAPTLSEKADHLSGERMSSAKETADSVTEKAQEGADKVAEKGSEVGDTVEEGASSLGEKVGAIGGAYGSIAGKAGGKAVGKAANLGITAASYAPKAAMKGANLAKRGGSAYWNVFKQPDVASSLGESARIARESPIGKPGAPDGAEDAAKDVGETETMDNMDTDDSEDTSSEDDDPPENDREEDREDEEEEDEEEEEEGEDDSQNIHPDDLDDEDEDEEDKKRSKKSRSGSDGDGTNTDSSEGGEQPTDKATNASGDNQEHTASPDNPADKLYEEDDPASRNDQPAVNEDAAEAIAKDIDDSFDQPSENKVRDAVHDRVDQDLGNDIQSMGAEHAVMDKYKDVSGRDSMRGGAPDSYKWS